ncbi:MAG TPA: hypothetical protein VGZ23_04885 [bacterium]|nr:hypothetical protein [bacterium]
MLVAMIAALPIGIREAVPALLRRIPRGRADAASARSTIRQLEALY